MMARDESPLTAAVNAAVGYGFRLLFTNSQTAITSRCVAPTAAATSRKRRSPRSARCVADDRLCVRRDIDLVELSQVLDLREE